MPEHATETSAIAWLRPEPDACWGWDAACEVIVWKDGTTLLFREELAQIVERLMPAKVPPAGLLFLLLAAAKGKIPPTHWSDGDKAESLHFLTMLAQLPQNLLSGVPAKTHLIEYFTGGLPGIPPHQAAAVLADLREGLPLLHLLRESSGPPMLGLYLRWLNPALCSMDIDALRHRLETGFDAAPGPAGLEPIAAQVAQLLGELKQDAEFAGLVQLVRDLMAALSLPHALAAPDLNALGGLSDISNRGPLHRLLTSELAHDHDVLAMRLALNEALYLKNEPPAAAPLSELVILLDAGIRLWGTPRIFATAAALALLAKVPKRQAARTFRAQPGGAVAADLTRKAELTKHLGALELNDHPAAALEQLAHAQDAEQAIDLVVITHERTLTDSTFRLPTALPEDTHIYLVGVNREGDIAMFLATPQGLRPLKQAKLDLGRLLPTSAPVVLDKNARFPAIFSQEPFPFLLVPPDLIADLNLTTNDYGAGVNQTGTVWYWSLTRIGARQLRARPLPGTPVLFEHDETAGCLVLLKYEPTKLHLLRWFGQPLAPVEVSTIEDVPSKPKSTFRRHGLLYLLYENKTDIIDLATGEILARTPSNSSYAKIGEGFYRRFPNEIGSLGWNGRELVWEPLRMRPPVPGREVLNVFQRQGLEGPWYIDSAGDIHQTCTPYGSLHVKMPAGTTPEVSSDGHVLWIPTEGGMGVFQSLKGDVPRSPRPSKGPRWKQRVPAPQWSIRTKFTHVALETSGHIALRSQKGSWARIELNQKQTAFIFYAMATEAAPHESARVGFKSIPSPPETDYTLAEATWPGSGSRIILDSRGMLHLQSGDVRIPEVSLVLAESNSLPAWSSDGLTVGPAILRGPLRRRRCGQKNRRGDPIVYPGVPMNALPLRLVPAAVSKRPASAWMISGRDPARWLREITRWGVDESQLALYLIPTSAVDLSPYALLVVLPPNMSTPVAPSGTPYGTLAGTVYLPVDAAILPAVSEPELLKLNRFAVLLLHPALGPIGFDQKDRLSVADLIAPLLRREVDWETAQPGLSVQPHLLSISIRLPTSLEELFSSSSTDIGPTRFLSAKSHWEKIQRS